jgi:hypothetical protein
MEDKRKEDYREKVYENIKKYGYHITFVFDDKLPSFCYSTGVYKSFWIPEIFISALPQNLSFELVKNYVEKFKNSKAIPLNEKIDEISDRFPVYLIEVPIENLKEYAISSIRVYGNERYEYVQLIYPDTKGRFPNESGYNYDQEIMGTLKIWPKP